MVEEKILREAESHIHEEIEKQVGHRFWSPVCSQIRKQMKYQVWNQANWQIMHQVCFYQFWDDLRW